MYSEKHNSFFAFLFILLCIFFLSGCVSNSTKATSQEQADDTTITDLKTVKNVEIVENVETAEIVETVETAEIVEIVTHKGNSLGVSHFPVWLETWFSHGKDGLEAMPDYQGYKCFVECFTGSSLEETTAITDSFSLPESAHKVNVWWLCAKTADGNQLYYSYLFYLIPDEYK